jgi:hypothetical protein
VSVASSLGTTAKIAARADAVAERYRLQAVARAFLDGIPVADRERRRGAHRPDLLSHRVVWCHQTVRDRSRGAEVWISPRSRKALLGGVTSCGSGWVCPVCAAKIAEHRRGELSAALAAWRGPGHRVFLVTLTARHSDEMELKALLSRMLLAVRWLRSHRTFKMLWKRLGCVGSTRSTEITLGKHGWHPHFHELWFATDEDASAIQGELSALWLAALERYGLTALASVAVDVRDSSMTIDEYVTKFGRERSWDMDCELSKHVVKRGRPASLTPFDLLRIGAELDERWGWVSERFTEYAIATFGVHMLQWSRGLRERLGLAVERSDAEVAAGNNDDLAWLLGTLTVQQFQRVVKGERVAELLEVAGTGEWAAVVAWVDGLPDLTRRERESWQRYRRGRLPFGLDEYDWDAIQVWGMDSEPRLIA